MNGSVLGNVESYHPRNYNFKLVCQSFVKSIMKRVIRIMFSSTGFKISVYERKRAVVEARTREYIPKVFSRRQKH